MKTTVRVYISQNLRPSNNALGQFRARFPRHFATIVALFRKESDRVWPFRAMPHQSQQKVAETVCRMVWCSAAYTFRENKGMGNKAKQGIRVNSVELL